MENLPREITTGDNGVYLARCRNYVKIGFSESVRERINGLQVGNPYPIGLIGIFKGGFDYERKLHRIYRKRRVTGEWFELSGLEVKQMLDEHDDAYYKNYDEAERINEWI